MVDLGTLGGTESHAYGVNRWGFVVGDSRIGDGTTLHAFAWSESMGMVDLHGPGDGAPSRANAINDNDQIVGSFSVDSYARAFSRMPGGPLVHLGTLSGPDSTALAVSNAGHIVGPAAYYKPPPMLWWETHAAIWSGPWDDLVVNFGTAGIWMKRQAIWQQSRR